MILKQIIFRTLCFFCHEIGFSATDTIIKIRKVFFTSYLPKSTLYRYYHDVKTINDIILKEPGKLDRVDYQLENQLLTLITAMPCQSSRQLGRQLGKSPSTILRYLHEKLDMTRKNCITVPHDLTPQMRIARVKFAKVIGTVLRELKQVNFLPLATTDESWIYYYNVPKQCYIKRGTTPPTIVRQSIASAKQMYIPVLTVDGVIGDYYVPIKSKVDSNLWSEEILTIVDRWWREKWEQLSETEQDSVRQCVDNARNAALTVIADLGLQLEDPIPGESVLDASEALVLKSITRIASVSTIDPVSTSDSSEETDHSEDLRPSIELEETGTRVQPARESALASQSTL